MYGEGAVLGDQQRPHLKRADSQRSPVLGFPSIYAYTLYYRTIKFDVVTHVWEGPPIPRERSSIQRFPFWVVLLYLCPHPLTQNYEIRYIDQHREGRVCMSATPLHLHKMRRAVCQRYSLLSFLCGQCIECPSTALHMYRYVPILRPIQYTQNSIAHPTWSTSSETLPCNSHEIIVEAALKTATVISCQFNCNILTSHTFVVIRWFIVRHDRLCRK